MVAVKQYLIFSASFFALTAMVLLMTDSLVRPVGCPGVLALEFAFTESTFSDFVNRCGATGVRAYIIIEWIDYIFIFAYAGFLANLLGSLVRGLERKRALIFFSFPLIAGLLDIIENTLVLNQLSNPETLSETVILAASTAALVKFALIAVTVVLIIYFLFQAASKKSHA